MISREKADSYDLAVIGSGPGGYIAGLYAARYNLKICVIEKDLIGGTCLNKGCVPSKSFINSASIISKLKSASGHGVNINGYSVDFDKMTSAKDEVVRRLRSGIETLLRANSIDLIKGAAALKTANMVSVNGRAEISAKNIIIASGSCAAGLPNVKIDDVNILSSDSILNLKTLPRSLIIIGGGVIGCEFAGLFNALGVKVTIVEIEDRLISGQSRETSKKLESGFKRRGIEVYTSSAVEAVNISDDVKVTISGSKDITADKLLVAAGRAPNVEGMGLDELGIRRENGRIRVDGYLRTDVPNIYAVGDCVSGPQLAHKALYDGMLACDNILGRDRKADYSYIPNCIWTEPEIASVGLCEDAAKDRHKDARIAKFPYRVSGKAVVDGDAEGFVKIVGTPEGKLIGVEVMGKDACNLIGEASLAMSRGVNIKDWKDVVHGHPTLSEIYQEACYVFCGTPIHSV